RVLARWRRETREGLGGITTDTRLVVESRRRRLQSRRSPRPRRGQYGAELHVSDVAPESLRHVRGRPHGRPWNRYRPDADDRREGVPVLRAGETRACDLSSRPARAALRDFRGRNSRAAGQLRAAPARAALSARYLREP